MLIGTIKINYTEHLFFLRDSDEILFNINVLYLNRLGHKGFWNQIGQADSSESGK